MERPTFHRGTAGADRAHRANAYRGHQFAGRVHLPDRAIPGPATTVTSGSKITRFWRLNGSSERRQTLLSQRTERSLYSAGYRCARHFRPRFRRQSSGTFGTEIKGRPRVRRMRPPVIWKIHLLENCFVPWVFTKRMKARIDIHISHPAQIGRAHV